MKKQQHYTNIRETPFVSKVNQPMGIQQFAQQQYQPYNVKKSLLVKPNQVNIPNQFQNVGQKVQYVSPSKNYSLNGKISKVENNNFNEKNFKQEQYNTQVEAFINYYKDQAPQKNNTTYDPNMLLKARSISPVFNFQNSQSQQSSASTVQKEFKQFQTARDRTESTMSYGSQASTQGLHVINFDSMNLKYHEEKKTAIPPVQKIHNQLDSSMFNYSQDITSPTTGQQMQFQKNRYAQSQNNTPLTQDVYHSYLNMEPFKQKERNRISSFNVTPVNTQLNNIVQNKELQFSQTFSTKNSLTVDTQPNNRNANSDVLENIDSNKNFIQSNQSYGLNSNEISLEEQNKLQLHQVQDYKKEIISDIEELEEKMKKNFQNDLKTRKYSNLKPVSLSSCGEYLPDQDFVDTPIKKQFDIIKNIAVGNKEIFTQCSNNNQLSGQLFQSDTIDIKKKMNESLKKNELIDMLKEELGSKEIKIAEKNIELKSLRESLKDKEKFIHQKQMTFGDELTPKAIPNSEKNNFKNSYQSGETPNFVPQTNQFFTFAPGRHYSVDEIEDNHYQLEPSRKNSLQNYLPGRPDLNNLDQYLEIGQENFQLKVHNQMLIQKVEEQEKVIRSQSAHLESAKFSAQKNKQFYKYQHKQNKDKSMNQSKSSKELNQLSDESTMHTMTSLKDSVIMENQEDMISLLLTQAISLEDRLKKNKNK